MLHRYFENGEKLDVAGLNQITVLIDRTETERTEVAINEWPVDMEGPPHLHAEKDQIFYIMSGKGKVMLGREEHIATPGNLFYVPAGLLHRTITTGKEPLRYLFFNIFLDDNKEGHASFADHIKKVKEIRKKQAETGKYDVSGADIDIQNMKKGCFFNTVYEGSVYDFGSNDTTLLLDRTETNGSEFVVVKWPACSKGALVAHQEKEQTFFILSGEGWVTIGNEKESVKPGEILFVPRNIPHTTEAGKDELIYLCLNSIVTETKDESFELMYRRIAPERFRRWKAQDDTVGE